MIRPFVRRLIVALAGLGAMAPGLAAQLTSTSVTVQMPVTAVLSLAVSPGSTPLTVPDWADFAAGHKDETTPLSLTAMANRSWQVTISASAATFAYTGSQPDPGKPRSDLRWAPTFGGSYTPMTGTGATVFSGGATNGVSQNLYYRTLWSLEQAPPGTYSLTVSFTIAAP